VVLATEVEQEPTELLALAPSWRRLAIGLCRCGVRIMRRDRGAARKELLMAAPCAVVSPDIMFRTIDEHADGIIMRRALANVAAV